MHPYTRRCRHKAYPHVKVARIWRVGMFGVGRYAQALHLYADAKQGGLFMQQFRKRLNEPSEELRPFVSVVALV